ncbi:MAG: hypothetical protein WCJ14_12875 [Verrucomicrobiota bacterium]
MEQGCYVKVTSHGKDRGAVYHYKSVDDIKHRCTLLRELEPSLVPTFRRMLAERGYQIDGTVSHVMMPELADRLVRIVPARKAR